MPSHHNCTRWAQSCNSQAGTRRQTEKETGVQQAMQAVWQLTQQTIMQVERAQAWSYVPAIRQACRQQACIMIKIYQGGQQEFKLKTYRGFSFLHPMTRHRSMYKSMQFRRPLYILWDNTRRLEVEVNTCNCRGSTGWWGNGTQSVGRGDSRRGPSLVARCES